MNARWAAREGSRRIDSLGLVDEVLRAAVDKLGGHRVPLILSGKEATLHNALGWVQLSVDDVGVLRGDIEFIDTEKGAIAAAFINRTAHLSIAASVRRTEDGRIEDAEINHVNYCEMYYAEGSV